MCPVHKKSFLIRPFWRDWVLAGVIIMVGFVLSSPNAPLNGWPGLFVIGIGVVILLSAIIHALWSLCRHVK
jgi:hypothetical protein